MAVMDFKLLGPLVVVRDGEEVDLGPLKQRSLLALLLIHANEVVPLERIVDQLWPDETADRTNAVRVYTSRLRAAIEPDRGRGDHSILETHGSGYLLRVDADRHDVACFERLIEQGRGQLESDPTSASATLGAALELWRGPALDDFGYDQFAQIERARLAEIRIGACEDRIDADLALGQSGQLVSEIEVLRQEHPLRERLVGQHMLALYRSGRAADALRAMGAFRRLLGEELGVDPSPMLTRLEEQVLLHADAIQPRRPLVEESRRVPGDELNPFLGLRSFDVADAERFFGRDALVSSVLRLHGSGQRLIALVGPSGSGKSSVVRAGLIPALAKNALPDSEHWLVAQMMPGSHPFAELEAALLRSTLDAPDSLDDQLRDAEAGILRAVLRLLPDDRSHLLLIIDQFEELFTMVDDEEVRNQFLSNLVTALDDAHGRISVIVTLRADFYGQPLHHPEFGARLGDGVVNVTPLTAEELESAALEPAKRAGVTFEPALLGQLIADVGSQPGALPLFQYTLTELFDRRAGDVLQISTYRSMGGVEGALQRRATDLYAELDDLHQAAAKQLFLRLLSISEEGQRSRRRVPAREVASVAVDTVVMHDVIAQFGVYRLLSFDADRLTGAPTVEVAHEALLTAWPTLEAWVDASRDDMRRHASLVVGLREWQLADRHPDYLLPVARLDEYQAWSQSSQIVLNDAEQGYLDRSAEFAAAVAAERERQRTDDDRARRRLWGLVAALFTTLGVAGLFLFGVFAPGEGPTVTFFGERNADAVGESVWSGLERADSELVMQIDDVRWSVDPVSEFQDLAETAPDIVITDASAMFVPQIFVTNPDIRFGLVDPDAGLKRLPNITYTSFRNEEGAFLAGVAAASTSETGVVGFVGGAQIQLIEEFRAGFEAGARAVDPEIVVLATFVAQGGDVNGFGDVIAGQARATSLYERNADVVFNAAGLSGRGIFHAAQEQSEVQGRQLWGIGVDVDQWFDFSAEVRPHVLTSVIKRQDTAAFLLAEHMIGDGNDGLAAELGLAEGGFRYSTTGNHLSSDAIAALDHFVDAISRGGIEVPREPVGPVLLFDEAGAETDELELDNELAGVDFPTSFAPVAPGTYHLEALGTPLTVTLEGEWAVYENFLGHTTFGATDSARPGDRSVTFLRPTEWADERDPTNVTQELVPASALVGLDGFEDWLDGWVDGVISGEPVRVEIGGREAAYFEADVADDFTCGPSYCAGFLVNTISPEFGLSGWSFEPGIHHRIWVVDGEREPPLVIIAGTRSNDRSFQADADVLLEQLVIGAPQPHPLVSE